MFFQNGDFQPRQPEINEFKPEKKLCQPTMVGSVSSLKDGEVLVVQTPILGRPRYGSDRINGERINGFVVTHWEKWGYFSLGWNNPLIRSPLILTSNGTSK